MTRTGPGIGAARNPKVVLNNGDDMRIDGEILAILPLGLTGVGRAELQAEVAGILSMKVTPRLPELVELVFSHEIWTPHRVQECSMSHIVLNELLNGRYLAAAEVTLVFDVVQSG